MKVNTKVVLYLSAMLIFILYLVFANYLFNVVIKTAREARLVAVTLPAETRDIKCNIEEVQNRKLQWKDALFIKGWAFVNHVSKEGRDLHLLLASPKDTLVFRIIKSGIFRPDLVQNYQMDGKAWNHGFSAIIPLYYLQNEPYSFGFFIDDDQGRHFIFSGIIMTLKDGNAVLLKDKTETEHYILHGTDVSIGKPDRKIRFDLERCSRQEGMIEVTGWGFLEDHDATDLKHFILLKKVDTVHVFPLKTQIRKDITARFAGKKFNLDASGFKTMIPLNDLGRGNYQLGLYLVTGVHRGIYYTNKYFSVNH